MRAKEIAHQIGTALYYLHQFGIVHRDLKPENLLMVDQSDNSEIRVADFGLSKTFSPGEKSTEAYGTIGYVAPEILMHRPYDHKVDCWTFGVLINLMLSGRLPFDSHDEE